MKYRAYILLAFTALLMGCATTQMSTYKDPKYTEKSYTSFLVMSNFSDLENKAYFESKMKEELASLGLSAQRGIDIILPTREYSDAQFAQAVKASGAQALLSVTLTNAYSTSTYVPPTYNTTGNAYASGNTANWNSTTYQSGGYNVNKPVEEYEISIIDLTTLEKVMISTSKTKGNAFAKGKDLSNSLVRKIVDELIQTQTILTIEKAK